MPRVNKSDLISQLSEKYGYTRQSSADIINDFTRIIMENLQSGNSVSIKGFGRFEVVSRKARVGVHPTTKERVEIKAHPVLKFYPYEKTKELITDTQ